MPAFSSVLPHHRPRSVLTIALVSLTAAGMLSACGSSEPAAATDCGGDGSGGAEERLEVTDDLVEAAQEEGSIYLRYSAQEAATLPIIAEFEEKFGVDVTSDRKIGPEGTQTFATEERAGSHIVDVHVSTDRPGIRELVDECLYEPYTVADIDDFPTFALWQQNDAIWGVAPYHNESVFMYNPDVLPTSEAERLFGDTWEGLTDPRFADQKMAIVNPIAGTKAAQWFWALSEDPRYGEDFLRQVADQDPIIVDGGARGRELLFSGEIEILVGDSMSAARNGWEEGAPVRWVYPDILPSFPLSTHLLSANAPHPNAARLMLAWLMSEEGAKAYLTLANDVPALERDLGVTSPLDDELAKTDWWAPTPEESLYVPDPEVYDEQLVDYQKRMIDMFNIPAQ